MTKKEIEAIQVGDTLCFADTGNEQTVIYWVEHQGRRIALLTRVALVFVRDLLKIDAHIK